jgi:hypothetical protein
MKKPYLYTLITVRTSNHKEILAFEILTVVRTPCTSERLQRNILLPSSWQKSKLSKKPAEGAQLAACPYSSLEVMCPSGATGSLRTTRRYSS